MLKKMPPAQKVLEAFTAIADERVTMGDHEAKVDSSDDAREYTVRWQDEAYASSDPATYWQGYPGYPVIAVLLMQGKLPMDRRIISYMSDIPWHNLNDAHKRDYQAALMDALSDNSHAEEILAYGQKVNEELAKLDITVHRSLNTKRKKHD